MPVSAKLDAVEASRQAILDEIGDAPDLTFVSGMGNRGDELIWAGTRALLSDRIYREVDVAGLCSASGHTALIAGSGGFCRPYHEIMPRALAIAALRFERTIVMPSSFDPSEDVVREMLSHSPAVVFARTAESYRRIVSLCDARLAHDCAFFFDYEPWQTAGSGTLNAFRSDRETSSGRPQPPADNNDISVTVPTLEEWLDVIADHELIRTDRAHVMIAGALLGKRVEFASSSYDKVPAIADFALTDFPVTPIATAPTMAAKRGAAATTKAPQKAAAAPRITAIVLTRDRPELAFRALDSVGGATVPVVALMLDNNSAPAAAETVRAGCDERDQVRHRRSDRNLGCAGGRAFAVEQVATEFVLFLDDDAVLQPGALEALVAELDANPQAAAVSATVISVDGTIQHSGGTLKLSTAVADFELIGAGEALADGSLPPSGPADWIPGTAGLMRRSVLDEFPIDPEMNARYEDNEWCFRVERSRPGSFRRSREAIAVHHLTPQYTSGGDFGSRSVAVEQLATLALFYSRHGLLLGPELFTLAPGLCDEEGRRDLAAARLLMELVSARGADWTLMQWMAGELDGIVAAGERAAAHRAELSAHRAELANVEAERDSATQLAAERDRQISELDRQVADQAERLAEQAEVLTFLHQRNAILASIEHGGWWRLRQRFLPLLQILWRLRDRGHDRP